MGVEPNTPTLQGSVAPSGMQAHSLFVAFALRSVAAGDRARLKVRPGIEPGLRPYHGRVRPKHLQTKFC
jgi:hypothetical protein